MQNNACFKEFIRYSSLNVLGMLGLSCYILADTFFVAKGLGTNGLTALNLALPVYSFIHGTGLLFGMGGASKYAVLKSQKDAEAANRVFTNAILLAAGTAFFFFVVGCCASDLITKTLGADPSVYHMSKTYLQTLLLFAPLFMLNNVLLCFVRNDGAPHLSMMAMLGGSFSNIILDYIFIFPLDMGIFGAVLATGLAPVISILILSPFFTQKKNQFHLAKHSFSGTYMVSICSTGLPSLITELSSGIVILVFNTILLQLQGNTGVAAYGVIANLSLVAVAVCTGLAQGIQPILSRNYGEGNQAVLPQVMRYAFTSLLLISGIVYACIHCGAEQIVGIFNHEQNPMLQNIAVTGLKIYFTGCLFAGCNIILSVYFTSTERARPAHVISLLRGFVLVIPMAFLLSSLGGILGVWWVFPVTELIVCALGFLLYFFYKKRQNRADF